MFGSNTNSSGLFASKAANPSPAASTGGLFGNTTANNATSGGLFGNSNTSSNTNTSTTTGGLFGNTTGNTNTTGSLFGNNQPQSQQNFSFGQQNQQQQLQQQQQQQQQQQTQQSAAPAFSWSSQPQLQQQSSQQPLSSFSSSSQSNTQNTLKNSNNDNYSANIQEQLLKIKNSWDPSSQQTVLKTYFYNKIPANQAALYVKPANEGEDWDKANEAKPGPDFVPVRAVGFQDLQKRSQTQVNHVAQSRVLLQEINEKYKSLSDKHNLDTSSRIVSIKSRNEIISKRILKLVSILAILKSKGYQLSPNEERLIQTLKELLTKSNDPSGLGKSNELWARLSILKEKAKSLNEQLDNSLGLNSFKNSNNTENSEELEKNEIRKDQILKISKILQQQQSGIKYLDELLKEDEQTLQKLLK